MDPWKTKNDSSGIRMFVLPSKSYYVLLFGLLLSLVAFFVLWADKKSEAGAITSITASATGSADASGVYTINLTPATTIPAGGKIHAQFQWKDGRSTIVPSSPTKETGTSASISSVAQDGSSIILATAGSEITGGTDTTVKVGGLTNPSAGEYYLILWTTNSTGALLDGSTSSNSTYRAYYTIGTPIVKGIITDPDGVALSGAWVNAFTNPETSSPMFGGGNADDQGHYSISNLSNWESAGSTIPSGTVFKISAFAPPEKFELGSSPEESITYNGSTITKNIQFTRPSKTIGGTVTYSNGTAISGARVNFWSSSGSGWSQTTTNSSGQYSVQVRGGNWEGMLQPDSDDDWSYSQPPSSISFKNDTSAESQTINFTATRASATISGSVRLPNGSTPSSPQMFHVGLYSMGMGGSSGELDSSGNFSINVAPGTYNVDINDWNQNYSAPKISPISVGENESKNVGTITLISRDATISGRAVDQSGAGVANMRISAFMMREKGGGESGGGGWAGTNTDSSGNFSLKVFPGKWMVQMDMWGARDSKYVLDGKPQQVSIESGETKTVNISLVKANSTIAGSIVDTNGNVISDMWGWVFANKNSSGEEEDRFDGPGLGGPTDRGQFSVSVPAGTYQVGLGPMPGSSYSSGEPVSVTVADGQTVTQNVTVYPNDMTITGSIKDENGSTVNNVFMQVFATNKTGGWQNATINQSNGTYSMSASSAVDPWNLGYFVDPQTGYFSERLTDSAVSGNSGDTISKDITLRKADATISGTVLDGDGIPMSNVFVFADNRSGDQDRKDAEFHGPMFMNDNTTDSNGRFSISVPHDTYFVGAAIPRDENPNLINPNRVELTLSANETKSGVVIAFIKADVVISGKVNFSGTQTQEDSLVWAWSEEGGYNETKTDENGNYSLNATQNDTWHLGVNTDVTDTTDYVKSSEVIIKTGNNSAITQNIDAELVEDGLTDSESTSFDPTSAKVANLSDGTIITVPANAMGSDDETTITLSVSSTSELPRTIDSKPIGTGLDLTAMDDSGTDITSFNSSVNVIMPYDDTTLSDLKITEDDLSVAYWDETNGIWQPVDSYSIDEENNHVSFSTDHFTIFSIVADAVSNDTSLTGTRATIKSWKAEKYLSPLGTEKLKLVLKGRHFKKDADVTIGGKSANSVKISNNGDSLTAKFKMKKFGKIKSNKLYAIRVTNPDAEVRRAQKRINLNSVPRRVAYVAPDEITISTETGIRNIQTILFNRNYLKKKDITGIYGPVTRNAVIRFQSNNGIPATGSVGPLTQSKLDEFKNNFKKRK